MTFLTSSALCLLCLFVSHTQAASPKSPIQCPSGTTLSGAAPPKGTAMACVNDNQVRQGPFLIWHDNGNRKKAGFYENGELSGKYLEWHEDGKHKAEGLFDNGKMTGQWTRWHANGVRKDQGELSGETSVGAWKFWNEKGDLIAEGSYRDGQKDCGWIEYADGGKKRIVNPKDRRCKSDYSTALSVTSFYISPDKTRSMISAEVAVSPRYAFSKFWSFQSKLGILPIIDPDVDKLKLIFTYGVYAAYSPAWSKKFSLAAGGGGVTWTGKGTAPQVGLSLNYDQSVNLGYAAWFIRNDFTHTVSLGFDITP